MKRYSLEGGVEDLVSREQVRLLLSLLVIGLVLVVGDRLGDVVVIPLLVMFVVQIDWSREHLFLNQRKLGVYRVLVPSVHNDCTLERSVFLLKLGRQGRHRLGLFIFPRRYNVLQGGCVRILRLVELGGVKRDSCLIP